LTSLRRSYLARRLLTLIPVWLGISVLAFFIGHLAPGDPGVAILSGELGRPPNHSELAAFDHSLGLNRPLLVQYWHWLTGALHGDMGRSYRTGQTVIDLLTSRFPHTLILVVASFLLVVFVAVPLGTWAAFRASALPDAVTRGLSVASAALPSFWVGYLLIITFAVHWHLVPAQGSNGAISLVLPAVTIAFALVGVPLRMVRTSVLEVLHQDYVRTARAVGTPPFRLMGRHVLRNAISPVVTYLGVILAVEFSTSVVVETVFAWPGVGLAVTDAIHSRDYPVVQGFVLLMGTLCVVINVSVDLLYRILDPRVRLRAAAGSGHG
jgi:ABC-type dipeptide/oligopeptide/nickel transport system permease component